MRDTGNMCGRFAASLDYPSLAARFGTAMEGGLPSPSWNISPSQRIAVIAQDEQGGRHLTAATWGLVPTASPTRNLGYPTHNARIESALSKQTFAAAARARRVIIPATGYYEWSKDHQPYYFRKNSQEALLIAGLCSWWREDEDSPWELTATILTTEAVGRAAEVHHRMPVLIPDDLAEEWMDPSSDAEEVFARVAQEGPTLSRRLLSHPVRPLTGRDDAGLTDAISI